MKTVNVREARQSISQLLDAVERGEEVLIERRGKPVARLVAAAPQQGGFPSLVDFRNSIPQGPSSAAEVVRRMRDEERC